MELGSDEVPGSPSGGQLAGPRLKTLTMPVMLLGALASCHTSKAASEGVSIDGPSGTFTHAGATVSWEYDAANQRLTVQCIKAPLFPGCGAINSVHSHSS